MNVQKYKVGEIYGILEAIYNDLETRNTVVPLFMSNPGLGKNFIIEQFMKDKSRYIPPLVLSQRMPFEISGISLVDKERSPEDLVPCQCDFSRLCRPYGCRA